MTRTKIELDLSCECGRNHKVSFDNGKEVDETAAKVIAEVSKETGVTQKAILGPSQAQRIARARGIVMARLRERYGYTYHQVAKAVGRKAWQNAKQQCLRYKGL